MSAIEPQDFRIYRFHPDRLDPVTVYIKQYSDTASRVIVQCYAQAWTAYWGAHGSDGVERFMLSCGNDYIADNLLWGTNGLLLKRHEAAQREYLIRIIEAIKAHFSAVLAGEEKEKEAGHD